MGTACQQLFVVACVVLLMEACRKSEIGQLDMAAAVEQNIVGLNITVFCEPWSL